MPDFVFLAFLGAAGDVLGDLGRAGDAEQLDVEHQHPRRAPAAGGVAVGEVAGDPEAALLADDHQLQALGPALDDVAERELRRLPALDRAVEHPAVARVQPV
jgi:hypothetical protein